MIGGGISMANEVTDNDISDFLDNRDDFEGYRMRRQV